MDSTELADQEQHTDASTSGTGGRELLPYTVAEAIDHVGFGRFQVAMLFYAGMVWAADAMEMMLLSFLGPAVTCQWNLSPHQEGAISTVVFVGTLIGAYMWGAISDAYGRRAGFFVTALFSFAFGLLSALAPSYKWLLMLRFFVGVGLGGAHVPVALYLEFVPTALRGIMLVALQSFWTFGTIIEALLAWGILSSWGWRWLLGLSAIPLLGLLLLYPVLPESPYYLAAMGQTQQAQDVLAKLARVNKRPLPPGFLKQAAAPVKRRLEGASRIHQMGEPFRELGKALGGLFTRALRLTSALLMFIWFTNALNYYGLVLLTTTIHTQETKKVCLDGVLKLSSSDLGQVFITSTAELPGLLVAALLIDILGRRRSMTLGMLTIAASTASLMYSLAASTVKLFAGRAASMGAFTVLYIYTPEVYPTRVRSFGLGVNNSLSRLGAILAPFLSVDLALGGHLTLAEGTITVCCLVAAVCTCLLPYETLGRSLQISNGPLIKEGSGIDIDIPATNDTAPGVEDGAGLLGSRGPTAM